MLNIISRRRSKQQLTETAPLPPKEYLGGSVGRKSGAMHPLSKGRGLTVLPKNYEVDVSSTLDYDDDDDDSVSVASSVCSLLYSDNEDVEHDFHEHRTQLKQSSEISVRSRASSVRSSKKSMAASSVCSSKKSSAASLFSFSSRRMHSRKSKREIEKK